MKYTVLGFQQEKLIANGLTTDDALILRTIKDMYSSASMEFRDFDGIKYMWINYTYLFKQIPITGSKRNLMRRIDVYGKDHLLLKVLERVRKGQKGSFAYVSPTEKLDSLEDLDPYDKMSHPLGQSVTPPVTKRHSKDTSIKDPSIKDVYGEKVRLTKEEYAKLVDANGDDPVKQMIDILDNWYLTKGKPPNKSDYHTMVGKGWVLKRFKDDQQHSQRFKNSDEPPKREGKIAW